MNTQLPPNQQVAENWAKIASEKLAKQIKEQEERVFLKKEQARDIEARKLSDTVNTDYFD